MQKILLPLLLVSMVSVAGAAENHMRPGIMGSNHHINVVGLGTPDSIRSNAKIDKPG